MVPTGSFMPKIRFQATFTAIGSQAILRVPKAASRKLQVPADGVTGAYCYGDVAEVRTP
jgi:hypothetical protein